MSEQKNSLDSFSEKETFQIAKELAEQAVPGEVYCLSGDLGVGKTAFVRGFASVFCPAAAVRSPTFALVNEYRGSDTTLFHFDMYRIKDEDDLYSIGFDDYLSRRGICLVEWSENIPFALPPHRLQVTIEKCAGDEPDKRSISLTEIKETSC